jgi:uncharacterized membrane protein YjgN (DUF898 family)
MTTADIFAPAPAAGRVEFLGREAAYWRLRVKGALLLLVTLGLYRFWFATDVRRYMWSSTEIAGDTLEYTGLATELLGGFLLAVAILVPLYTGLASAALAFDTAEQVTVFAGFVLIVLLGQFALFRARRYRLTRTVFRGVRFDQHGSAWHYALYALAWWTLVAVTLGLAYPWALAALERFKMRRTSYGDLHGSFVGSGWALFWRGLPIWLAVIGPLVFAFLRLAAVVDWDAVNAALTRGDSEATGAAVGGALNRGMRIGGTALAVSVCAAALLYPPFKAIVLRWWISGLRFGSLAVASRLRIARVYRIYLRFVLLMFLFLLLTFGAVAGAVFGFNQVIRPTPQATDLLTSGVTLGLYVVTALGASTIYQVAVTFALWRLGAQTAELAGGEALDGVRAAGAASSALGEGLADALGIGGV